MKFADITGHHGLKSMLARSVDEGRVSHAQLFTGLSGYGTLPLALAYAQYVNCTARSGGDSCGECPSCRKSAAMEHPDLHFTFPSNKPKGEKSSKKSTADDFLPKWRRIVLDTGGYFDEPAWYEAIDIDNKQGLISRADADAVIRKLSLKAFEGAYKIMVVWLPERMRVEAANGLLKILEEPWERTLFLLVSEQPEQLLPTILSRVQQVVVPAIGCGDTEKFLARKYSLPADRLSAISRLCGGDLIRAQRMAADEGGEADGFFTMFTQLMRLSYNDRHMELLEWGEEVASLGREEQKRFLRYGIGMLRESYLLHAGMEDISYLWGEEMKFGRNFAPFIGNHNIEPLVAELETAIAQVSQNVNPRIVFPHLALAVSKMIVR